MYNIGFGQSGKFMKAAQVSAKVLEAGQKQQEMAEKLVEARKKAREEGAKERAKAGAQMEKAVKELQKLAKKKGTVRWPVEDDLAPPPPGMFWNPSAIALLREEGEHLYGLGHYTTPGRMYHAPSQSQLYYMMGDHWAGFGQGEEAVEEAAAEEAAAQEAAMTSAAETEEDEERKRRLRNSAILYAVRGGVGLVAVGSLVYAHRRGNLDWYCSVLPSLVWGGLIAEAAARVTGLFLAAKEA